MAIFHGSLNTPPMMEHGLYRIFFELAFANIFSLLVIMETLS